MQKTLPIVLLLTLAVTTCAQNKAINYELPRQPKDAKEQLVRHEAYTMSFNTDRLTPTYVAWCLTPERVNGRVKRTNFFDVDPSLNARYQVKHGDYYGSGFDRGHICPAADNSHSQKAMEQSFYMSNMCPQSHALNSGGWNDLEVQCRSWARNYGRLYICAGPIYNTSTPRRIGTRRNYRIAVPDRFFKVILMRGKTTKAIGFIYPNAAAGRDMRYYAVSVDEVERITGLDFFYQLDDTTEKRIEAECKPGAWGI